LCAWLDLGRRVKRLFGLLGRHLPGRVGRLDLPELRPWFIFGVGRERLLELLGGHLSAFHRCFRLHCVRRGNCIGLDWGVGFEHLRSLLGGLLLFDFGGLGVRGMFRG
jgi:hypothetical protein